MAKQRDLDKFLSLPVNGEETWQGGAVSIAGLFGAAPADAPDAQLVLLEFRKSGRSAVARKTLRAAFGANEHVVPLLESDEPPQFPDSYALGSPEEAAICMHELSEAWDETDGYVPWMLHEYFLLEREQAKRRDAQRRRQKKKTKSKRRR